MDPTRKLKANAPLHERTYPNRWAEDRNLRSLHRAPTYCNQLQSIFDQPQSELKINNLKYLEVSYHSGRHTISTQIIKLFIKPECVWKLLKWVNTLPEEHKRVSSRSESHLWQGLRVINTIIEIKGEKRFKGVEVHQVNQRSK